MLEIGLFLNYFFTISLKDQLAEAFWFSRNEFARSISTMASTGREGKAVDYFGAIRERTQAYIDAMDTHMTEADPSIVVGALFAQLCGNPDAQRMADAGRKVFVNTLNMVKMYLDTVDIEQT